jgi:histidine phosphotransferase ChpT
MMNLIMLGLSCLSRQGKLKISVEEDKHGVEMTLVASGPKARLAPDVRAALNHTEPDDGWDPRTIQPYFTTMIVDELGGALTFRAGEDSVQFQVTGL